jgi:hypothetical protein
MTLMWIRLPIEFDGRSLWEALLDSAAEFAPESR